jgi:uncharacterized membrane protein YhaH (DUF805 family)
MKKYLSFNGVSARSEYWGVTIIAFIAFMITLTIGSTLVASGEVAGIILGGLIVLASVVMYIWYFLAVTIKRCRDADINPWWTAATFIPYIGWIPWIVFGCLPTVKKDQV